MRAPARQRSAGFCELRQQVVPYHADSPLYLSPSWTTKLAWPVRKLAQQSAGRRCKLRERVASMVVRGLRWHPALQQSNQGHQLPQIAHSSLSMGTLRQVHPCDSQARPHACWLHTARLPLLLRWHPAPKPK